MAYMPATSKEDVYVRWGADAVGQPVQIAIVPPSAGEPGDADYRNATWVDDEASLLVGAGTDVPLAPGVYVIWSRVTIGSRRPVRRSGLLTVGTP
ncbi:hypothetical protein [Nonomuraea sp. SYSU D8015]|uniref:hypothetical protein n=1 Tax=Nonomuraea sp. SYSU D8015 TaxID=2593644 RepID=UPI001661465A|nr:hypothetical protein [Nonomuraea sp. SYSU D8015]